MVRQSESSTTTRRPPRAISFPSCCETADLGFAGNAVERHDHRRVLTGALRDLVDLTAQSAPCGPLLQMPASIRPTELSTA